MTAHTIKLDAIRVDGGTQPRAVLSQEQFKEYADDMRRGNEFPPVTVFHDGSDHWLADGFHRYHATAALGLAKIAVDVRQGTHRNAVLFSVGANASHGLRRSNDDKRRAVQTLLDDAEWAAWSDREIARRCGVSDRFVNSIRPSAPVSANGSQIAEPRKVARGGSTYTMDVSAIGTTPAPEPPVEVGGDDLGEGEDEAASRRENGERDERDDTVFIREKVELNALKRAVAAAGKTVVDDVKLELVVDDLGVVTSDLALIDRDLKGPAR